MARRFDHADLYAGVALAPLPCRMLLVTVCDFDQGAGEKEILSYPVVAIRSAIRTEYVRAARPGDEGPRRGVTHEEMTDLGYKVDTLGCHLDDDLLVIADLDGADAVYPAAQITTGSQVYGYRVVACPWPPESDRARVEEIGRAIIALGRYEGSTGMDNAIVVEHVEASSTSTSTAEAR